MKLILSGIALAVVLGVRVDGQAPGLIPRLQTYQASGVTGFGPELSPADWTTLTREVMADGPRWLVLDGRDRARQLSLLGSLVLDAAAASVDHNWDRAKRLIEWVCTQYRRDAHVADAEKLWHLAALSVIEGAGDVEFLSAAPSANAYLRRDFFFDHLTHVDGRLDDTAWTKLSRAMAHERTSYPDRGDDDHTVAESEMRKAFNEVEFAKTYRLQLVMSDERRKWASLYRRQLKIRATAKEFADLRRLPDVSADATLREGVLLFRLRAIPQALDVLAQAASEGDSFVRYVANYFAALVLEGQDDLTAAEARYRAALRTEPHGQAAAMRLAALLARTGRVTAARAMIDAALEEPLPPDPVKTYGSGTFRMAGERIAALKRALGVPER